MKVLYSVFIFLFRLGIAISALWNEKAKAWIGGRKNFFKELESEFSAKKQTIWIHCASAGEFEQGKPVIERLKEHYPSYPIVVSFFSPSGFGVGKKYGLADHIVYLPLDTPANAKRFVEIINPTLVVFIKYDYWYFHLKEVAAKKIPLLLASAIFRKQSIFFKPYGSLHRSMLYFFQHIFVQDKSSKEALRTINVDNCSVAGDTRFDRVTEIAAKAERLDKIENFVANNKILVAGSTWPDDEKLLEVLLDKNSDLKIIIAPHEINKSHILQLQALFPSAILYSQMGENQDSKILIVDNIGMLSRLYRYAALTYIGGGFNKSGIHNTLEAAVWGKPVIFGPNYKKFKEAKELIEKGAAYSINNSEELNTIAERWLKNSEAYNKASLAAELYVKDNTGATQKIVDYIQENRLLTTP